MPGEGDERTLLVDDSSDGGGDLVDYEEELEARRPTKMQWFTVLVCGMGNGIDAVEVLSVSFILPALGDEIPEDKLGYLGAAVFMGMLVGAIVAGFFADRHGRQPVLAVAMLFNFFFMLGFSMSKGLWMMTAFRFMTGCGVGGAVPVVFSMASEVMPRSMRGAAISIVASFFMVGSIGVALLAWLVIPHGSWRLFAALCSLPALFVAVITLLFLKESPRFLLASGRANEATATFKRLTRQDGEAQRNIRLMPVEVVASQGGLKEVGSPRSRASHPLQAQGEKSHWSVVQDLFSPKLRGVTGVLCLVTSCMGFGWYGLIMWMPALFKSRHVDMCIGAKAGDSECTYQSALFAASSCFPGNMFAVVAMDRYIPHRQMLAASLLLGAGAGLFAVVSSSPWELGLGYCAFNAVSTVAWNSLDVASTESFPTSMRGTSMGILSSIGRLAATAAQLVYALPSFQPPSALPIMASAIAMSISSLAALYLPHDPEAPFQSS
eukprot:CAMPEP_0173426410 /NCGR_PEP_ID=MMETSP1357-20121228/5876_1 /TAXON_ID=77926 /ORGANISM="Hemiselmis rufescens, Strain PCC563" /LENGTH=492 /DNA_ID=CAMNT_0014390069 /DNA_START=44 /DNA_END=1522 /DNA_ORIENTATION=-